TFVEGGCSEVALSLGPLLAGRRSQVRLSGATCLVGVGSTPVDHTRRVVSTRQLSSSPSILRSVSSRRLSHAHTGHSKQENSSGELGPSRARESGTRMAARRSGCARTPRGT